MRYLLLAAAATVLFFGAYWLMMRREKRHTMVRYYLVGTLLLSLLLPAIHLRLAVPRHYVVRGEAAMQTPVVQPLETDLVAVNAEAPMQTTTVQEAGGLQSPGMSRQEPVTPLWQSALPWVWLGGCLVALVLLAARMAKLHRRMRSLPYREVDGMRLTLLDDDTTAFSFGRHIVVGTQDFTEAEVQQLVGHETVHVRQSHTADLLLVELMKAVLWFDPFIYLYARELKRVHEYIADSEMMSADYAELFYHQVSGHSYSPLCNTFDYGMVHQRIAMMAQRRTAHGWLKPLVLVPLAALVLVAGCVPKGTFDGSYKVDRMTLMSDNPAEPDLLCTEFMGLEDLLFCFQRNGQMELRDLEGYGHTQHFTYTVDNEGMHLYDSTGNPWMDLAIETLHCDGDSIVLRFIDPDPLEGLGKMLRHLPPYRYRIDTVEVSTPGGIGPDGVPIELNAHLEVDTTFAHITAPCEYGKWRHNRLLTVSTRAGSTGVRQYIDTAGNKVETFFTGWEFRSESLDPDARELYSSDSWDWDIPYMEGDRFIFEVVLKK
ncbi:MAG: hypothetical protein K6E96_07920 [Bacteroidales bacterium]|nr:hypothetical protein [Bacteroidales bacterium]